jgi:hypothetical protein
MTKVQTGEAQVSTHLKNSMHSAIKTQTVDCCFGTVHREFAPQGQTVNERFCKKYFVTFMLEHLLPLP